MRFSVVVPVYNVADYLAKCLDSVLPALKAEDEVILSLGRSEDMSSEIAAEYAGRYANIKIIQQNGQGLSNARNCAVAAATGDYIICVDSDDYVRTDILRELLERFRHENWQYDVIAHDYYRLDRQSGKLFEYFQIGVGVEGDGLGFLTEMLTRRQCFWNVWRFIYGRYFLLKNGIGYLENVMSEDVAYTADVLIAKPEIKFVHYPFYVYTVGRGDSLMDKPTFRQLKDTLYVLAYAIDKFKKADLQQKDCLIAQFQFEYLLNTALIYELDEANRKAAVKLFADWRQLLTDGSDTVVKYSRMVLRLLGIRVFGLTMHIMKKIKRLIRRL